MSLSKITDSMLEDTGTMPAWDGSALTGITTAITGVIGGLTLSNNGTDGAHDIDIATGYARDYGDAFTMQLATALTKQIDATWAVGTNAGGLDTGVVAASTGYGVYLIRRSDTGVVDALFSTDMSAAGSSVTMPTSYDQKRLIGWVRTDGSSNILAFTQSGDYFQITGSHSNEISDSTITSITYETGTLTTPPLCPANIIGKASNTTQTETYQELHIRTKGSSKSITGDHAWTGITCGSALDVIAKEGLIMTNASSQIDYAMYEASGSATVNITVTGVLMTTRSNPQ